MCIQTFKPRYFYDPICKKIKVIPSKKVQTQGFNEGLMKKMMNSAEGFESKGLWWKGVLKVIDDFCGENWLLTYPAPPPFYEDPGSNEHPIFVDEDWSS